MTNAPMNLLLKHSKFKIQNGTILITGSKSETNRLLLLQALYPNLEITNISNSDDSKVMIEAFKKNTHHLKNNCKEITDAVSVFINGTNEILAEQYFVDLNAQVEKLCRKNLPQTEWHELRKLIKQRIYAYNWVQHETENDDPNFSYYNKLQEAIGLWHDLEFIKESFSQKQVYLSQDIEVQKDFNLAWDKLNASLKYREKHVEEMLSRQVLQD